MDRGDAVVTRVALTVAGSDSGGGAGIQADLKTFTALGLFGTSAITAVTAQNTLGVRRLAPLAADLVATQIAAVCEDFDVSAVKVGMLGAADIARAVAATLPSRFVVCDPVLRASSGDALSSASLVDALRDLLPRFDLITPNLSEAARLTDTEQSISEAGMIAQGRRLLALGSRAALIKGGHLDGDAVDLLVTPDGVERFAAARIDSPNLHGTGCVLSSAIAAYTALGHDLSAAVRAAKLFTRRAIEAGRQLQLGRGPGPLMPAP